jgi:Kef-type K+ transport system membrane component KefB
MAVDEIVKVFALLRVIQGTISLTCGIIHSVGFNNPDEPHTQLPFFLATYFGLFVLSVFGLYKLIRRPLTFKAKSSASEMAISFILFIVCSIWSMVNDDNCSKKFLRNLV